MLTYEIHSSYISALYLWFFTRLLYTYAAWLKREGLKQAILNIEICWHSTYNMLFRVVELKVFCDSNEQISLSVNSWNLIKNMINYIIVTFLTYIIVLWFHYIYYHVFNIYMYNGSSNVVLCWLKLPAKTATILLQSKSLTPGDFLAFG